MNRTASVIGETQPAAPRGTLALRRWVTIAGIVLIVLIVAADSYEAWADYRRVIDDNEHIMVALSRALSEQTARLVQEADVVLQDYAGWLLSAEGRTADQRTLKERLQARFVDLPFVSSAALIGADGVVRASTRPEEDGTRNLADTDLFSVPAHAPGGALYIDRPRATGDGRPQSFGLSRRAAGVDGAVAGVLVARISFAYLTDFYAHVDVTPDTSIRLVRADGASLAEYPSAGAAPAAPVDRGTRTAVGQADARVQYVQMNGQKLTEVSREVAGYPIFITVSRSSSSVLKPWVQEERNSAARTLTLAAFAALLLVALRSALQRQEQTDQARHRLEQELAGIRQVDALGFLAASVAHDFNNVLTAIIGYAELIRDMVDTEPATLGNVDRLLAATERARLLVRRVLTFDPHRSVSYRPTAIAPILVEVVHQVQATLAPSITIEWSNSNDDTTIVGDATEIYQVLMNLCSNAVHAMTGGGQLTLQTRTVEVLEARDLALGRLLPGRWVTVAVRDSGTGLAGEQLESMFEPFYTTRPPTHGTGIGLTVVRNIISRMNGALDVDSRLGSGTEMTVYWPSVAAPTAMLMPPNLGEGAGAGETILVVDDERELVVLTEELLASLSYEPVGFSDARAALDAFKSDPKRFDAILTDERMQPLRGLEFARLVRQLDATVPIILMTGHRDAAIDSGAKRAGIVEILDKPVRVQTLRAALARQLRRPRM